MYIQSNVFSQEYITLYKAEEYNHIILYEPDYQNKYWRGCMGYMATLEFAKNSPAKISEG